MSDYFDKFFKGEMYLIQDNKLKKYRYQATNAYKVDEALRRFLSENEDAVVLSWNIYKIERPKDRGDLLRSIYNEWLDTENIDTLSLFDPSDPYYRYEEAKRYSDE